MPSTIGSYGLAIGFPPRPTGHQHGSTNAGFVFSLVVAIYCHVGCIYHTIKDVSHTINDVSINFGDIVADPIGVAARLVGGGWYLLSQTASGPYQSTLDTSRSDRHLPLW